MPSLVLPGQDPAPEARKEAIGKMRAEREYIYDRPAGVACLKALPPAEIRWSIEYMMILGGSGGVVRSHFDGSKRLDGSKLAEPAGPTPPPPTGGFPDEIAAAANRAPNHTRLTDMAEFALYPRTLQPIPVLERLIAAPKDFDMLYGWNQLGGANPYSLAQVRGPRLPENFPVTEGHFERAMTALKPAGSGGDSLARALSEGRLFISDCQILDGLKSTDFEGQHKYLTASMGLFVRPIDNSAPLLPVAIQCSQSPSSDNPVFTPADGYRWRLAQAFLACAEASIHEAGEHLANTHLVVEAFALASRRNLAPNHPVIALLLPHFQGTHLINYTARHRLIADGGTLDQMMPQPIAQTAFVAREVIQSLRIDQADPVSRLRARGLLDAETLPNCPYREDMIPHWRALLAWVGDYLRVYYPNDQAVVTDSEVQDFIRELGAQEGARLNGVPEVNSIASLAYVLSICIFSGSLHHAAVNFPQYPVMGYVPWAPGALYSPPPTMLTPDDPSTLINALPPLDATLLQMYTVWQLSAVKVNTYGDYPTLLDPAVQPALEALRMRLATVDRGIVERNVKRPLPYLYLKSSRVPASIHI